MSRVDSFHAMGCAVVVAGASSEEVARIRALFQERDAVFSRFRAESELRRVNAAGGATLVSPLFASMLEQALWASETTGGLVDPTLGAAIEAAGYDRDFAAMTPSPTAAGPAEPARPDSVLLLGRVLVLRGGVRLDLNGVVKAAAVDDALRRLSGPGLVSAGGDLATHGEVDVALPGGAAVRLVSGGLATSGQTKRRWLRAGREQHHLIDPATGRPSASPWNEVTVCGASCLAADVAAKAAFLLGEDGPSWLDERGLPGRFLAGGREPHENLSWRAKLEPRAARVHLTTSPVDWYAARAAGVTAYVLLSIVVLLGMTMAGRARLALWPRFALEDVHRFCGLLVGSFIAIHVFTIAIDAYLPFSLTAIAIPFVAHYRPLFTALGIVAAELLLALAITNHYRDRLPHVFWRRAHYLNLAVWSAATVHGLGSGTDRSTPWLLAIFAVSVAAVLAAGAWRALGRRTVPIRVGAAAVALSAVGVAVVVLASTGPLRFSPKPWNARAFDAPLSGTVSRNAGATRALVSAAATAAGRQRALIRADLLVEPTRLDATSFQLEFLPSGMLCKGKVTKVQSLGFDARCRAADGTHRYVHASWGLSQGNTFQGRIAVHA